MTTPTRRVPITKNTTTNPIPASLRQDITTALLSTPNALPRIQDTLLHELQSCNWTSTLRTYVLGLLRSGECSTYDELMGRVMAEAREDGEQYRRRTMNGGEDGEGAIVLNGTGAARNGLVNGNGIGNGVRDGEGRRAEGQEGLRIPERAIREGIKAVRKELDGICEFVPDDEDG